MKSDFAQAARIISARNAVTVGTTAFWTSFIGNPDAKESLFLRFIIDTDTMRAARISVW
jgi:hypothetical protein